MGLGRKEGESVTRYTAPDPLAGIAPAVRPGRFSDRFLARSRHPAVPGRDALAILDMDTAHRRHLADIRVGPRATLPDGGGGWEWVYVHPLDPATWYAERPAEAYPLARMLLLWPGYCPAQAEVRGRQVEVMTAAGLKAVVAGDPRASRLLRRPRLLAGDA